MKIQSVKPRTISPNFYQLKTPFFPVYLSVGEDAMLIEGGTGATFDIIVEQVKELGMDPQTIKYLVLTHTHFDHIGALPRLRSIWPHFKVLASPAAPKMMSSNGIEEQFRKLDVDIAEIMKSKGEIPELPPLLEDCNFQVDTILEDGEKVELGNGISWTVLSVPGHSPCQIALFEEKEGTLVIGDATGYYYPEEDVFWPNYFAGLEPYCNSIKKLAALPAKRLALSHNGVIEGESKKFLEKALKTTQNYHQEMLERTKGGEDPKKIALEKAKWVNSIADHMPFDIAHLLCGLLIKLSQKQDGNPNLSFDL